MSFFSALLFGISANIDTFVLGLSHGLKKQYISFFTNILLSIITFIGTILSIGVGMLLSSTMLPSATGAFGSLLLIFLGLYYVGTHFRKKRDSKSTASSFTTDTPISRKEIFTLGIALTMNNAGMGICASFAGIPLLLTSLSTLLFSATFLAIGNHLAPRLIPSFFESFSDLISGLIIILLGLCELLF